ncbi:hypothetical protein Csa_016897 [Cucumis sativus]|uniref:Uncharacterized protein n=1 Tax=Cucumis sativus TaxID=3659 RepID=A0A0A0KAN2_CUCSA|nr:hypothetical protein Csa_016897 [Cucumis sativus]
MKEGNPNLIKFIKESKSPDHSSCNKSRMMSWPTQISKYVQLWTNISIDIYSMISFIKCLLLFRRDHPNDILITRVPSNEKRGKEIAFLSFDKGPSYYAKEKK